MHLKKPVDTTLALKYMLISTFAFACMNVTVKHLEGISTYQIVFFRALGSLVFTFWFLAKHKISILGKHHTLLVLRGIVGVSSMLLFFSAVKYLSVGTAISLRYLAPVFAAIFAVFLLKERIKPVQWLFFTIAFSGVLILKGIDKTLDSYGLLLVLLSAVLSGLVYIIISKIGKREHPLVIVNYFMLIATITGGLLSLPTWVTPKGSEWIFLALLGVFGYIGQIFMTRAFQTASTNQVAPMKYIEVMFTMGLGICFFNELYTLWSILGILFIITGLLLNINYKQKQHH
jgi:drug/metabolite transporter (DMT)-like permease